MLTKMMNHPWLPARLTVEQAAQILGFTVSDLPILIRVKLLKPLGNCSPSCVKFFHTNEVFELAEDKSWMHKATAAVQSYWRRKNAKAGRREAAPPSGSSQASAGNR